MFRPPDNLTSQDRLSRLATLAGLAQRLVIEWSPYGRDHAYALCSMLAQEAGAIGESLELEVNVNGKNEE